MKWKQKDLVQKYLEETISFRNVDMPDNPKNFVKGYINKVRFLESFGKELELVNTIKAQKLQHFGHIIKNKKDVDSYN